MRSNKVLIKHKRYNYKSLIRQIGSDLDTARITGARSINSVLTATYWLIGMRIVEFDQKGSGRAKYGAELLPRLSEDLTARYGRGFSLRNLELMRLFYLTSQISQTVSAKSHKAPKTENQISQTVSAKLILSTGGKTPDVNSLIEAFPLSWSHYVRLLTVDDADARKFYEAEALRGGWSVRQLDRQISSRFYERTLLSKNKAAMLKKGNKKTKTDILTAEDELKDPFILEFLGLKDEYSESDLEESLIKRLENFLLELGGDFAFVAKQRRLRVGNEWYRVDLLFFHRKLKCLVIIDLKVGKFTHADAGQMHLYLNYAREHWTNEDENPPVGLILCAEKDSAVAKYSLNGLQNKVLAAEYKLALPNEKLLQRELVKTQQLMLKRRN